MRSPPGAPVALTILCASALAGIVAAAAAGATNVAGPPSADREASAERAASTALAPPAEPRHPAARALERGIAALRDEPEASRREAEAALAALVRAPDADLEIRARLLLCDYHSERDPVAAQAQIAAARARLPDAARASLAAGVTTCEGELREAAGDYAGARAAFESAAHVASTAGDDEMLAGALFSRGYLLGVQGDYAAGLADLKQSQRLYERLSMAHHELTALNAIAILYNRMGDFAEARHIYERALVAQRAAGMRREQGVTLHNLGRAHEGLGEWPAARRAFEESLAVHGRIGYGRGEAYALRGLAAVANAEQDAQRALALLGRASKLQRATPDARLAAQIDLARGTALRLARRGEESAAALGRAREVFERADALAELAATWRELAAVRADLGDWRGAYEAQVAATTITERLLGNQRDQRFAALKVEFDTAAKEKENALLLRENAATLLALSQQERARRLQWAVLGLTALLAALLATLALRQWHGTRRMRALAMTDELTDAPNRRAVLTRLDAQLALPGARCSVALLDVDHFKSINDQHGHPAGDEVLRTIAAHLRAQVPEPAYFGRLGGEEFLVVLPGADAAAALAAGERLREAIRDLDMSRWFADGRGITASLGVATQRDAAETSSTLLQRADAALYEAKRSGRNLVVASDHEVGGRAA
jgi:diguanylate cyclase (GGDEF)-like protein